MDPAPRRFSTFFCFPSIPPIRGGSRRAVSPTRSIAFIFSFFSSSRSFVTASVARQVSRSHDLRYFPPPYFLCSPGVGRGGALSRLARGHYLIFRLETPHPQEKRSGWGGGEEGRLRKPIGCSRGRSEVLACNNICIRDRLPFFLADRAKTRRARNSLYYDRIDSLHYYYQRWITTSFGWSLTTGRKSVRIRIRKDPSTIVGRNVDMLSFF